MAAEDLLIVAGEASGDLYGARLLAEVQARLPGVRAFGLGGRRLAAAGMDVVADAEEISAMGLGAVLKIIPKARRVFKQLLAEADRRSATTAVLIDYPEFNLRLARRLHERGIRVVYYVSPQIWAWRRGRIKQVKRWVDRMLVLFPFEEEFYARHDVEAVLVGHPLVDEVPRLSHVWDRGAPPDGEYRIALMPGSRRSEIDHLLPVMLQAARLLDEAISASFVLIRARSVPATVLAPHLSTSGVAIEVVSEDRFDTAATCHLAVCASGTANLELALVGTPMIVAYRVGPLSSLVGRLILSITHVSLVNLLLGRRVVPELLQRQATADLICDETLRLLRDPPRVEEMRRQLSKVRGRLGKGDGSRRAAEQVLAVMAGGAVKLAVFLLRYLRRHLGWLVVAGVAAVAYAVTTVSLIGLIEPVFSEVLLADAGAVSAFSPGMAGDVADAAQTPEDGEETGVVGFFRRINLRDYLARRYDDLKVRFDIDSREVVIFLPVLFLVVFLFRGLMSFVSSYSFNRVGLASTTDIRNDLYRSILSQSSRFHAAHPSGELTSRIVNDVAVMQNAISNRAVDMFQQSLTLIGMVYFLLSANLKLALISLVAAPLLLWPIVRFGRGMRKTSHRSQERMADLANLVGEGVRGHRVVKAFGMERFEDERFQGATRRHLRVNLWAQMLSSMSSPIVESMAAIFAVALLIYAGFQIRSGALSPSLLVAFLLNLFWMYDPIRKLNKVNLVLQQSLAATHRVHDLIGEPNEIVERPDAVEFQTVVGEIVFDGISFGYTGQGVLHGIDLEIAAGEVVALVGPSGAGKTTLVNLLPRFFDPDEGRLTIDGVDIRDASLSSLRSLIGLVTQETVLFNDTVRANLAYGRADLPLERIREAAAAAYADEFVMRLPMEYETVVGEGGYSMSGGQRQRLAIARALLKNAPILILDEATSHLDSHSEALVQKALTNLMRDRTTLVIAHRLSTVAKCDRIIVLDQGRIVEQGSHDELLTRDGLYKQLYDLQFRE